jgi:Condensation domain
VTLAFKPHIAGLLLARLPRVNDGMLRSVVPAPIRRLVRSSIAGFRDLTDKSPQLARVSRDRPLPVSMKMEEAWQRCQTPGGNARYLVSDCARISGPLNTALLRDCLSFTVGRHEILRSTFADVGGKRPVQIINPPEAVPLRLVEISSGVDLREVAEHIAKEEKAKIFLGRGIPTRFLLLRASNDEHWMLRTFHHLLWDQWATRLFHNELALLYESAKGGKPVPLPAIEPLQYADYSSWQRRVWHRGGRVYRKTIGWWKEVFLDNPSPLELPFKRPMPVSGVDPAKGCIMLPIEKEMEKRLNRLGRSERTTFYVIWLTALVAVLARETGKTDIAISTPMTGRIRHPALLNMIGDFSNPMLLRFQCDRTKSFRAFAAEVGLRVRQVQEYSEIPDNELRNVLGNLGVVIPEARVAFEAPMGAVPGDLHFADLTFSRIGLGGPMPSIFCIQVVKHPGVQMCHAIFDAGLYEPAGAQEFVRRLCQFVDAATRNPDSTIGDLV